MIYIETNLANWFIQPSKSPIRISIFFVQKPDQSQCLYIDYQNLNNLTIENRYPLPLIEELLNQLEKAKEFTRFDLTGIYHCLKIKERNEWKTVFSNQYDYYKYQVIFFGLFNTSARFQGYINMILAKKLNIFIIMNLDDIFIYIKNPGQASVN